MRKLLTYITLTIAVFLLGGLAVYASGGFSLSNGGSLTLANGASTVLTAPVFQSTNCINYDTSVILTGSFSSTTVTNDLTTIKNQGYTCIRDIGFWTATSSEGVQTWMYRTGIIAHSLGLEMRCANQGPQPLTATLEAQFIDAIVSDVNNGETQCDKFDVTNEQTGDNTTITAAQTIADIRTIATTIKNDGIYTHPISVALINNFDDASQAYNIAAWVPLASGGTVTPLDQICDNIYGRYTTIRRALAQFYSTFPNGCVTEWNYLGTPGNLSAFSDLQNNIDIAQAMQVFRDYNAPGQIYYFTYKTNSSFISGADSFAVALQDGSFRSFWNAVFKNYGNGTY